MTHLTYACRLLQSIQSLEKNRNSVVYGAMGCGQKWLKLVWQCHQLLVRFLAKGHLPRVFRLSANDKGDIEMILGAVHRSPGFYLTAEKNPIKPQLEDFQ